MKGLIRRLCLNDALALSIVGGSVALGSGLLGMVLPRFLSEEAMFILIWGCLLFLFTHGWRYFHRATERVEEVLDDRLPDNSFQAYLRRGDSVYRFPWWY